MGMLEALGGLLGRERKGPFTYEEAAELVRTSPEALRALEKAYGAVPIDDGGNLFKVNSRGAAEMAARSRAEVSADDAARAEAMAVRIADELLWLAGLAPEPESFVTREEIASLPEALRPQCAGTMTTLDLAGEPSCRALAWNWNAFRNERDPRKKARLYGLFRQGLDLLDLDPVTYEAISRNPCSMGAWFPALERASKATGAFDVPETRIVRAPLPLLQMTRIGYARLTETTLRVADLFAKKAFGLDRNRPVFIRAGTGSSKSDFRNARVSDPAEIDEIGRYLLFVHFRQLRYASPLNVDPKTGRPRSIYGAGTTTEWRVREWIPAPDGTPEIYHGLPLRAEARIFVDFDEGRALAAVPYWEPETMERKFRSGAADGDPDAARDLVTYLSFRDRMLAEFAEREADLMGRAGRVAEAIAAEGSLTGQWSLDVMLSGGKAWAIDMAPASESALKDRVPAGTLSGARPEIDWMPDLSGAGKEEP